MHREFRVSTDVRNLGIAGVVLFAMVLGFTQAAVPPETRPLVRIALAAFWGLWILASIHEVVYYARFRLVVDGSRVRIKRPLGDKEIDLATVASARWSHLRPHVRCCNGRNCIRLGFESFCPEDRLPLIRLLREAVPQTAQRDWDVFCHCVALPWQRAALGIDAPRPLRDNEILLTRRTWDRLFGVCLTVVAMAATLAIRLTGSWRPLLSIISVSLIWLSIRTTCPQRGQRFDRITKSRDVPFLGFLLVWAVIGGAAVSVVHYYLPSDLVYWIGLGFLMLGLLPVGRRFEKQRAAELQQASQGADSEWNRLLEAGQTALAK
jgi:hypothetical protein